MDFYSHVPKTLQENLEYRIKLRKRAEHDVGFQRAMMTACKHDVLYWLAAFAWLYEPRPAVLNGVLMPKMIPFIPWPNQEPVIRTLREKLGFDDIGVEKSRTQGASWIAIYLAMHDWLFDPGSKISMVSSTADKADSPEDPDSLFWKIDWGLTKLPIWMAGVKGVDYKRVIDTHAITNYRNENARIVAYAATDDVGRGGRSKWFLMDELAAWRRGPDSKAMASTQQVTRSRFVVSTPEGSDGAYYTIMHEDSNIIKLVLDWKDNPTSNSGLYKFDGKTPTAADADKNPLLPEYSPPSQDVIDRWGRLRRKGFKLEGTVRSSWYDRECDRPNATPKSIAQELDRDYGGSMHRVFGHEFHGVAKKSVRAPLHRGMINFNRETLAPSFDTSDDGLIRIWTPLDAKNRPPAHPYVVGVDVCAGLGGSYGSNSVCVVLDLVTREQVLEYAINTVEPGDFADECMAISKWFHDAYLCWESDGPGKAFTNRVKHKKYTNVYMRTVLDRKGKHKTKEMGWTTQENSKKVMFDGISMAVRNEEFILRSDALVRECGQYVWLNGLIKHVLSATTDDDSSAGKAHGDRVIAFGVALMGAGDRPLASTALQEEVRAAAEPGTMAYRMKQHNDRKEESEHDAWDHRTNDDLARGETDYRPVWLPREYAA